MEPHQSSPPAFVSHSPANLSFSSVSQTEISRVHIQAEITRSGASCSVNYIGRYAKFHGRPFPILASEFPDSAFFIQKKRLLRALRNTGQPNSRPGRKSSPTQAKMTLRSIRRMPEIEKMHDEAGTTRRMYPEYRMAKAGLSLVLSARNAR